jgi:hypothetical protein
MRSSCAPPAACGSAGTIRRRAPPPAPRRRAARAKLSAPRAPRPRPVCGHVDRPADPGEGEQDCRHDPDRDPRVLADPRKRPVHRSGGELRHLADPAASAAQLIQRSHAPQGTGDPPGSRPPGRSQSRFPHLAGTSVAVRGTCLAREPPWLYFCFAVPRQNRRSHQGIGSQEPMRIGPPGSLRPVNLDRTGPNRSD